MKRSKFKHGAYTTLPDDVIGDDGVITSAVKDLYKEIRNVKGRRFFSFTLQKGVNMDDFMYQRFTLVLTAFSYKKPRFIK